MNFVDEFLEVTAGIPSPEIFRRWAAISAVAGALERKAFSRTSAGNLYPCLYILLVGLPGVGKTQAIWRARRLWEHLADHKIAHSSLTAAALIDTLEDSLRTITDMTKVPIVETYNALLVAADEFAVLLPAYDNEFMAALTTIYDCESFSQRRRHMVKEINIKKPYINLLGGCTPAYLNNAMPEGAWEQGFAARLLLIYSGESEIRDPFAEAAEDTDGWKNLEKRITEISKLHGQFVWSEEAVGSFRRWLFSKENGRPDHPRLMNYNTRRYMHCLKLCMVASAATRLDLRIEGEDVTTALNWLTEAEFFMPDIFKAMANTSHKQLMEEIYHFIFKAYMKANKTPVASKRVYEFASQRTPAHNVERVLDVMVKGGMLGLKREAKGDAYFPSTREDL